jgi:hypothetical protein
MSDPSIEKGVHASIGDLYSRTLWFMFFMVSSVAASFLWADISMSQQRQINELKAKVAELSK